MTAPLCLNSQVIEALGDWPLWTYGIASSLYGDPTDKGMPAYQAVIKRYKAEKNAPDPWHIVAFSQLLTTVRFLNEVGANKVTPVTGPGSREGVPRPARTRSAEAPVRQVQGRASDLQRHDPGVHVQGQVPVHPRVGLDRTLEQRRPFVPTGPVSAGPVGLSSRGDVNEILLFLLLGLGTGGTIAAIAVGIVVTYRGSGFINLAAGAIAMLAGFSFWALRTGELGFTLSTPPAVVLTYAFVVVISIAIELAVFRPLRSAAPLAKLVASLGVLLAAQATMLLAFGTSQHPQPTIIPIRIIRLLDGVVPLSAFVVSGIVVGLTAVLWALYRWTRFGLATRAASENDVAARLAGLSPNELSLTNTLLANLLLGTLGILAGSVAALDTTTLPFLVVPALAAALFARLTSFWIACACGLGIGMIESLIEFASTKTWFPTTDSLAVPGVKELLVFVLIVAAMFLRGASLPTRGELVEQRLPDVPRPKHSVVLAIPSSVICAIALVVLPFDFRQALTNSLIGIVMALSLVVITGFVGQISVVQLALAGVAGFTVSHLAVDAGIGFPLAPLAGIAAAVLLGLVTAVSALRVRGVSLAVVTIAAAVAIYNFGFVNPTWGGGAIGSPVPDPHLFGINLGPTASFRGLDGNLPSPVFGWVALTAAVVLGLLVVSVRRGILGRRMLAVRSNERAAAAAAINVRNVKLTAFGISALIAGVAGTLYAYNFGSVSADRFSVPLALSLIAFAYTGGITLVSGAVFAGLVAAQGLFPYALDKWFGLSGNWFLLFGGVILIFTLISNPEGVAGAAYRKRQAKQRRRDAEVKPSAGAPIQEGGA